jgi:hypothetical protein
MNNSECFEECLKNSIDLHTANLIRMVKNALMPIRVRLLFMCWNWNDNSMRDEFKEFLQDDDAFRYVIDEFVKRFIPQDISKCILIFDLQDEHVTEYFLDACIYQHGDQFLNRVLRELQ